MEKRAFTLIELLVVIAIVGLLSTVAVVSMSGARSKARDAKWLADKNQIIKALNLYYSDHDAWPSSAGTFRCFGAPTSELCWGGGYSGLDSLVTDMTTYMAQFPTTGATSGNLAYNRFIYNSNIAFGSHTGAYLAWYKENTMTSAECEYIYHYDKYWYCFEFIGSP